MATIKLSNAVDEGNAVEGLIPAEAVRKVELEAIVDTGATMLAIPEELVGVLGLRENDRRKVKMADGRVREVARVGGIRFEVLGRDMTCDALFMPAGTTPLIGQLQLEALDLIVDSKSRDVMVNPASPDMPMLDLLAC